MSRVMLLLLFLSMPSLAFAENPEEEATIGRKLEGIEKASTFIKLLKNTDKAEALLFSPSGETTVFVPTNEAFEKMNDASRERLFDPSNKHWLERVLTYHALHSRRVDGYIVGRVEFLRNGLEQYLTVTRAAGGETRIDGAKISDADLVCSNGIVHFIDSVLEPVELDLYEQLEHDGRFSILTKLITRSGLSKLFQNRHQVYTVFAPTDEAFKTLPEGTVESLMSPEKLDFLSDVIRSHIVQGIKTVGKVEGVQPLGTPGTVIQNEYDQYLIFRDLKSSVTIDDRTIIEQDRVTRNGFLHVIDRPLLPKRESLVDRMKATGKFEVFLSLCRQAGLYDLLGQFNEKITVFAPVDETFEGDQAKKLLNELSNPQNVERLRGILQRHFVRGNTLLTTNSIAFRRYKSTLNARIDLERSGDKRTIQGVDIVLTDLLARNGVVHGIAGIVPGEMELVDQDQNWNTYRKFVTDTLAKGSQYYSEGNLREATDYFAKRNYEFRARYGSELKRLYGVDAGKLLTDDVRRNFRYDFALTGWAQREGFRELLRSIEQKQPLLIDEINLRR